MTGLFSRVAVVLLVLACAACGGTICLCRASTFTVTLGANDSPGLVDVTSGLGIAPELEVDVEPAPPAATATALENALVLTRIEDGAAVPFELRKTTSVSGLTLSVRLANLPPDDWFFFGFKRLPPMATQTPDLVPGFGYGVRFSGGHHAALRSLRGCGLDGDTPTFAAELSENRPEAEGAHFQLLWGDAPCTLLTIDGGAEKYQCGPDASAEAVFLTPVTMASGPVPELFPGRQLDTLGLDDLGGEAGPDGCTLWSSSDIAQRFVTP